MPTHSLHVVRMEPLCEVEPIVEIFSLASGACSKHSFFPTLALLLIVQVSFMEDHCDLDGPPLLLTSAVYSIPHPRTSPGPGYLVSLNHFLFQQN
jgi:hypothetical protein